ncbi:tail fiber protein [Vibrio phage CHOED]|uniref:tail fiber protein n=1 Tax=Vibrio phage CHOED TaxID=1458716 RepID=UPI00042ECE86|nr:tail fiber protein [Vibrio phage CHOED]AHK11869.1 tail fiber repeat family protein [Vibrio phage CHOED]
MLQVTFDITTETPELTFSNVGIPGPRGLQGIQGEPGKDFKYTDFTPEQLAALVGPQGKEGKEGKEGKQGIKGDTGNTGLTGPVGPKFLYTDFTDDDKNDLRQPLRDEFSQTLADSQAAASQAAASSATAQGASLVTTQDKQAVTQTLATINAVKADIDNIQQSIDQTSIHIDSQAQVVDTQHSDVVSAAGTVNTNLGLVIQYKDEAAVSRQSASQSAQDAQAAAQVAQSALVYEGLWDPSTGVYPTTNNRNGVWKVVGVGTVGGINYQTGQELIWYKDTSSWQLIPSSTLITAINGYRQGDIVLTAADVGALPSTTQLFSGAYGDLSGKPTSFTPSAHTQGWSTITGKPTTATRWPTYAEVTGKPTLFSGKYGDLTGIPTTFPSDWATLTNKPPFATRWPTPGEVGALTVAQADAKYYSPANKPAWADVAGNAYVSASSGDLKVGSNTNLKASRTDKGFLPAQDGTGSSSTSYLGRPDWWFKEAWVNTYRGGAINITDGATLGGTLISNPSSASTYSYQRMPTYATGSKTLLRKFRGGYGDMIWHETVQGGAYRLAIGNEDSTEFLRLEGSDGYIRGHQIYTKGNKPTAADVGALSVGGGVIHGTLELTDSGTSTARTRLTNANGVSYLQVAKADGSAGTLRFSKLNTSNDPLSSIEAFVEANNFKINGHEVYTRGNKPSPADIGALPAQGKAVDSDKLAGFEVNYYVVPSTVVVRNANGDVNTRTINTTLQTQSEIGEDTAGIAFRLKDGLLRFANKTGLINWLGRVNDSTRFLGKTLDEVKTETRAGLIPDTRTVNGKRLNANIVVTQGDVGLGNVANFGNTNSYAGTSTALYATQKAAYDAAAAPRLEAERKRKITHGTAAPSGGADGDIYLQYK